jgi:hypothetical protein
VVSNYKIILQFITGMTLGIEFPHLTKQFISCVISLIIFRIIIIRQLI